MKEKQGEATTTTTETTQGESTSTAPELPVVKKDFFKYVTEVFIYTLIVTFGTILMVNYTAEGKLHLSAIDIKLAIVLTFMTVALHLLLYLIRIVNPYHNLLEGINEYEELKKDSKYEKKQVEILEEQLSEMETIIDSQKRGIEDLQKHIQELQSKE